MPFRGWLLRITANVITDLHRSSTPAKSLQEGPRGSGDAPEDAQALDPPDPSAEASIAEWEGIEDFTRLIAALTEEQQEVLRLRFAESLSIGEIALHLGRSEGSVKMLLLRGLQHLRRTVGPSYFSAGDMQQAEITRPPGTNRGAK